MNDGAAMTDVTDVRERRRKRLADLAAQTRAEVEKQAERRAADLAQRIGGSVLGPELFAGEAIEALARGDGKQ